MGIEIYKKEHWGRWEDGPFALSDFTRLDPEKDRLLLGYMLRRYRGSSLHVLFHRLELDGVPAPPEGGEGDAEFERYGVLREQVMREDDYWTIKAALEAPNAMMRRFAFCRLTGFSWPEYHFGGHDWETYACGLKTQVSREDIEDLCRELVYENSRFARRAAAWLERLPTIADDTLAEWAKKTERKWDRDSGNVLKKRMRPAKDCPESEDLEDKVCGVFDAYIFRRYQRRHLKGSGIVLRESVEDGFTETIASMFERMKPHPSFGIALAEIMRGGERELTLTEQEIDRIAWSVSPRSRQHSFYLWMAYWYGIDVDVDDDRALQMLADAAERGHLYACDELVHIYASGEYVRRDFRLALQWQEKKVGHLRKAYEADERRDRRFCSRREPYVKALRETGDLLAKAGRDKRAKQYYRQAEQIEAAGENAPIF